ncbi:MAG: hypothetical protein Q4G69_09180 [Planctomycetia bacterium]|nr:hypothetical protein [Planctomycetia bacterium]
MKGILRFIILLIVGVLFALTIYPVGRTAWSDGIRDQVRKARAARRAKMESQSQLPVSSPDGKKERKRDSVSSVAQKEANPAQKGSPAVQKGESSAQKGAVPAKGPTPKPPKFSAAGLLQGAHSLLEILAACLITALFVKIFRRFSAPKEDPSPSES